MNKTNPFKPGDKVLRKSDTQYPLTGTVEAVSANRCQVAWPENNRINGSGFLHTTVKHTSLIAARPEIIKKRTIKFWQNQERHYLSYKGRPQCPVHHHWISADDNFYCYRCETNVEPVFYDPPQLAKAQAKLSELMAS